MTCSLQKSDCHLALSGSVILPAFPDQVPPGLRGLKHKSKMSDYGDDDFMCDEDEDYDLQYSEVRSLTHYG